jgi:hypothetical protein
MFRDGVLDITLGVGYDEANWSKGQADVIRKALTEDLQFELNPGLGRNLMQLAGHPVGKNAAGDLYARQNLLTYHPPAAPPKPVHGVVRLLDGSSGPGGGEKAAAFEEGMTQSDVVAYGGHGRYGSGPDFNRNFDKLEVLEENGMFSSYGDYEELDTALRKQGAQAMPRRSAWEQFLWLEKRNRVFVKTASAGNVFINPEDLHKGEFGARLMYWALKQDGKQPAFGRQGKLGPEAARQRSEHPYRIMLFDGCRTKDYVRSIRATPGFNAGSADVITTQRLGSWADIGNEVVAFLKEVIAQQSAEEILRGVNAEDKHTEVPGTLLVGSGFGDNPVNKS